MTTVEITPATASTIAMPLTSVVPWLVSLRSKLHTTIAVTSAEQQVLHLIKYVASAINAPVGSNDLDDRLDVLISSEALLTCLQDLSTWHLAQSQITASITSVTATISNNLDAASTQLLTEAQPLLDAWLSAQHQAIRHYKIEMNTRSERRAHLDLTSPDLPAELAECLFHTLRAIVCILALACTVIGEQRPDPCVSLSLTERFIESAKYHLCLLASIPGIVVNEIIVPHAERLDLGAIKVRHQRARDVALRTFRAARKRPVW